MRTVCAIDPGARSGVCIRSPRPLPCGSRLLAWACRGDEASSINAAVDRLYTLGATVACVERIEPLPHAAERASRASVATTIERAGAWVHALQSVGSSGGIEVVRAHHGTWPRQMGACRVKGESDAGRRARRMQLAAAILRADGGRVEGAMTEDVACAVLMATWAETEARRVA